MRASSNPHGLGGCQVPANPGGLLHEDARSLLFTPLATRRPCANASERVSSLPTPACTGVPGKGVTRMLQRRCRFWLEWPYNMRGSSNNILAGSWDRVGQEPARFSPSPPPTLRSSRQEGATNAPLPRRAPGPPGRKDAPRPTADKGRREAPDPRALSPSSQRTLFPRIIVADPSGDASVRGIRHRSRRRVPAV